MAPFRRLALLLALCCLTAAGVVWLGQRVFAWTDHERIGVGSSLGLSLAERIQALERVAAHRPAVAFLGDSTVMAYAPGRRLPDALQRRMRGAFVFDLAFAGMGAMEYFCTAAQLRHAPLAAAILPVNLATFSERWQSRWARPEGTGWLPFDRGFELMRLPAHWFGVTLDRFLFYRAIVASGHASLWNRAQQTQARAGRAIERVRRQLQPGDPPLDSGMPPLPARRSPGRRNRPSLESVREAFGPVLAGVGPDHPVVEVLRATARELARREIRTVAYVVPFNVAWIRSLGVYDEAGVAHSVRTIRSALEAEGVVVVDLHALLPDHGFRDANHFTVSAELDGPDLVAAELAPVVAAHVQRRPARPGG
jgi:hypothetical protein